MNTNNSLAIINNLETKITSSQAEIIKALPAHVEPIRFCKSALLAVGRDQKLQQCTLESVFTSILNAAELGLDFTPAKGHAYMIAYKNVATFMPGYRGMIDLAKRSNIVSKIESHVVYEKDIFSIEYGLNPKLVHKPCIDGRAGQVIGAYSIAWLKDEEPIYEFMSKLQIDNIRKRAKTDNIWATDYAEMARKTTIRRLFKYLPSSPDIEKAMELDNRAVGIDENNESDGRTRTEKLADLVKSKEIIIEQPQAPDTPMPPAKGPETNTNPPLASGKQTARIYGTTKYDYNLNKDDAIKLAETMFNRKLQSMKDLTTKEASTFITGLDEEPDSIKLYIKEMSKPEEI